MGPCLCGDLYCGSCGPAQGNHRCGNCGEWADEHGEPGSEHDDDRCSEAMKVQAEAEYEWEQEMEKHEEAIKHLLDEPYWRTEDPCV